MNYQPLGTPLFHSPGPEGTLKPYTSFFHIRPRLPLPNPRYSN